VIATDAPDMSVTTTMSHMFYDTPLFNGNISSWDVSRVTDMNRAFIAWFGRSSSFNADLSSWDVSKVTIMEYMFALQGGSTAFNADIASWNVASVTNMLNMFNGATAFNGNLSGWNVARVASRSNFCGGGSSSICGIPAFTSADSGCTGGRTIQTYGGSSACSCPAGEVGTPGTDAVCGTRFFELTQT
jgi:surface protein